MFVGNDGGATMRNIVVSALFFIAMNPTFGQEDVSVHTINKIKKSIVPVICGYTDEQKIFRLVQVVGTGFFVDTDGRFITPGHVLDGWKQISKTKHECAPAIYVPSHGWRKFEKDIEVQWFTIAACTRDQKLDLAVCKPDDSPFTNAHVARENIATVAFDTNEWPDGTPVAFTGFPLQITSPITSKGFVGGKLKVIGSEIGFDYAIDKAAWPGASGSPLYLPNGNVIGILFMTGINQGTGLSYARSASIITEFLKRSVPKTEKKVQKQATPH